MKYNLRTFEGCVALLDEKRPGWESKIDLSCLDQSHVTECILGQLYGLYAIGLAALDIVNGDDTFFGNRSSAVMQGISDTNNVWKEFIFNRLKQRSQEMKSSLQILAVSNHGEDSIYDAQFFTGSREKVEAEFPKHSIAQIFVYDIDQYIIHNKKNKIKELEAEITRLKAEVGES